MTVFNFPDTAGKPTDGTFTWTAPNGLLYSWDGVAWRTLSSSEAYVNISGDTMTGDLTVPSLNGGQLAGFRNQLINGDFRIWQRGTQFLTLQVGYSADHWFTDASTNTRPTQRAMVILPGFTYGVAVSGSGTAPSITQPIELTAAGKAGQFVGTWTLSFWTNNTNVGTSLLFSNGGLSNAGNYATNTQVGNLNQIETAAGGWVRMSQTYTMVAPNTGNTSLNTVIYGNTSGDTFNLTGIQLEPGPVATPFEHRPIGTELALCKRYYQVFTFNGVARISGDKRQFSVFNEAMRATPTVTNGAGSARGFDHTGDVKTETISANSVSASSFTSESALILSANGLPNYGTTSTNLPWGMYIPDVKLDAEL